MKGIKECLEGLFVVFETGIVGFIVGPILAVFGLLLSMIVIPVGIISALTEKRTKK